MKLSKIAEGKLSERKFMNEIRTYSTDLVKQIKTAEGTFRHDNMTNKLCPNCGKRLLAVMAKQSDACMSGSGMRIPADYRKDDECPLSAVS